MTTAVPKYLNVFLSAATTMDCGFLNSLKKREKLPSDHAKISPPLSL